ncbi:MAG TPA: hypothetical protein VEY87_10980 [Gaiellaceae bacterium]|nr:hypothetical protein [Gaiellaceae bacterium]
MAEQEPTEEQLLEALQRVSVADMLVQSLSTVSSLAFHRLAPESRDLEQARLGIEALRAVVPLLRGSVPDELARDLDAVTANLQLAYADAVAAAAAPPADPAPAPAEDPPSE